MNYTDLVYFYSYEIIANEAQNIFKEYKDTLASLFISHEEIEIHQMGSSSIPGMLSKKDVDIQIRVPEKLLMSALIY